LMTENDSQTPQERCTRRIAMPTEEEDAAALVAEAENAFAAGFNDQKPEKHGGPPPRRRQPRRSSHPTRTRGTRKGDASRQDRSTCVEREEGRQYAQPTDRGEYRGSARPKIFGRSSSNFERGMKVKSRGRLRR